MAIRKDLDDMLNSLKPADKKAAAGKSAPTQRKTKFDDMSVDDLLGVLSGGNSGASDIADAIEEELANPEPVQEPEPIPEPVPEPEPEPIPEPEPEPVPEPEQEPIPEPEPEPIPEPVPEPVPEPEPVKEEAPAPKKKRIVITGELPDYEAIRQRELEKDREEKLRQEAESEAAASAAQILAADAAPEFTAPEAAQAPVPEELQPFGEAAEIAEETVETVEEIAEEKPKKGFFSRLKNKLSHEDKTGEPAGEVPADAEIAAEETPFEEPVPESPVQEIAEPAAEENSPSDEVVFTEELIVNQTSIDDVFGEEAYAEEAAKQPSVDELMEAAIAAVNEEIAQEEVAEESLPEPEKLPEEEPAADPVDSMIENMRSDAASAIADIEAPREEPPVQETAPEYPAPPVPETPEIPAEEPAAAPEKSAKKGRLATALGNILDEDPEAIMDERTVKSEDGDDEPKTSGKLKKTIYAILGVIFAALACVGLVTVITKGMAYWGSFTSGETKRDGFVNVIYPAVIMDIESFQSPSELTSEQVITAALWSMIMDGTALDKYQKTFDVVNVPATDVEAAAVKLFGENLPQLTHTTVGPANSRFYYNEDSKSYNVPVKPATYTYSPDIKSVAKNGSEYTLTVDYIDELPAWMEKTSSKSVEFKLTETNDGYQISAMKVLSENDSL